MAIALVQAPALDRSASAPGTTSQTYTWGVKPTVGNKVIWAISQYDVAATATVTDNAVPPNTFTARLSQNAGNVKEWLFEGDIVNVPVGAYINTLNYTATCYPTIAPLEVSGLLTGNSYDTGVAAVAIGTVPNPIATTSTATLAQADNLVVSLVGVTVGSNSGLTTPATGYTLDQVEQDGNSWMPIGVAHKIVSATTAQSASWPNTGGGGDGVVLVAVFKGAAASGTAVNPGVGSVALTGYAPSISQPHGTAPGVGSIALTGYAPTIAQPHGAAPGVKAIVLTGYAPTIAQPHGVAPGVGAISFTGYAPAVTQGAGVDVAPGVGSLTLTGYAPSISQSHGVAPGVGALVIAGYAPTVTQVGAQDVAPGVGSVALTGYAPTVTQSSSVELLGGGPGGPRKRSKGGTESYLERLLGRPLEDELEPEEIEVLEQAAQVAAVAPQPPSRDEAAQALQAYGIAFKDAYVQIFQEMERQKRQQLEDDEIVAIIAAAL